MLIYTFDSMVKQMLLNLGEILVKEKSFEDKTMYIFQVKNPSNLSSFSSEDNAKIFIYNHKMYL